MPSQLPMPHPGQRAAAPAQLPAKSAHESPRLNITSDDSLIAVMGMTGVGKSTFISHFSETAKVGIGLESCTTDVSIHKATVGDQRCYLIDTPGFDDTHQSDTNVLRKIADWLSRTYQDNIRLSGIVYLQRITDPRVGGSSLKNLRMFKKLCGRENLPSVVLATTMWSQVNLETGEKREMELITNPDFWGRMVQEGSEVLRQDQDKDSATRIIQHILSKRKPMVLDIQKEMASGITLDETSAGQQLGAELETMRKKYQAELKELREEMVEAQKLKDKEAEKEILAIRKELKDKMERDKKERESMNVTMKELREQRDVELKKQLELQQEKEKFWKQQAEFQRQQVDDARKDRDRQEELRNQETRELREEMRKNREHMDKIAEDHRAYETRAREERYLEDHRAATEFERFKNKGILTRVIDAVLM